MLVAKKNEKWKIKKDEKSERVWWGSTYFPSSFCWSSPGTPCFPEKGSGRSGHQFPRRKVPAVVSCISGSAIWKSVGTQMKWFQHHGWIYNRIPSQTSLTWPYMKSMNATPTPSRWPLLRRQVRGFAYTFSLESVISRGYKIFSFATALFQRISRYSSRAPHLREWMKNEVFKKERENIKQN